MSASERIVPLVSSSVMGPLGVRHLPRLWAKLLLAAMQRLPEGYRSGIGGFDEAVCDALGVNASEFVAYVTSELPTYLACEGWMRSRTSGFDHEKIARFNDHVVTRTLDPELAAKRRAAIGSTDEYLARAVALNDLDDWQSFHEMLTRPIAG